MRRHLQSNTSGRRALLVLLVLVVSLSMLASVLADPGKRDESDSETPVLIAQDVPTTEDGDEDRDAPERAELRARIVEKVRKARRKFMREHLELDDSTADALEEILDGHHKKVFETHREIRRTRHALVEAVKGGEASDDELEALERAHAKALRAHADARLGVFSETRAVLTPEQQAKLHIALPAFERRVKRVIKKARARARHGKDRGPRRPRRHHGPRRGRPH